MSNQPYFMQRLGLAPDADERAIKRAYARELKLIDQEANPAGFQDLRESYEAALYWLRHQADMEPDDHAVEQFDPSGQQAQHHPALGSIDTNEADLGHARENQDADSRTLAMEVFSQFQQRCTTSSGDMQVSDSWRGELQASLADARLINIVAREAFEQHVAKLLASGWRPGHHALFIAAIRVFEWDRDQRRVLGLGEAGYTLDAAIGQRAMYELQSDEVCELQGQLIVRLRDPQQPSTRELIASMPTLETLAARFPTWLALITDAGKIACWRELDEGVPHWRRKLKSVKIGMIWPILIAFWVLMQLFTSHSGPNKQAPSMQTVAAEHVERGNELLERNDTDNAITSFDRAIRADPNNAAAYAGRAMAYIFMFDDQHALIDLDKLETMDPSNPRLYRGRGILAYRANRDSAAIAAFTRSIELAPGNPFTLVKRALAYERDGQQDKALADADEAIRLEPDRFAAYSLRARVFTARGDRPKVLAQAAAVLAVNDKSDQAYMAAARMQMDLGERKEALAILDRGVAVAPTASIHIYRAEVRPSADTSGRQNDIKSALKLDPHSAQVLGMRAELELDAGQYEDAIAAFNLAIEDNSTLGMRSTLIAGRGVAYAKQGDKVAADSDFELARSAAATPLALNNLCWYLAVKNIGLQAALTTCNAALAQVPESSFTLDSKGFVLVRLKRYREAIFAYDAALKRKPGSATSLFGRGIAKHRLGDVKGGNADRRAAIAANAEIAKDFADIGATP